jgi:hypothetical protein
MIKWIRMRWAGHEARMGDKGDAYRLLVGKPEGKGPLDIGEVGWGGVVRIGMTEDRKRWRALVNSVMSLRVP